MLRGCRARRPEQARQTLDGAAGSARRRPKTAGRTWVSTPRC